MVYLRVAVTSTDALLGVKTNQYCELQFCVLERLRKPTRNEEQKLTATETATLTKKRQLLVEGFDGIIVSQQVSLWGDK